MSLKYKKLINDLNMLGCVKTKETVKVIELNFPGTRMYFYLLKESRNIKIIVHPKLKSLLNELREIKGIMIISAYYHHSNLSRFPKRKNNGKDEIAYGLAIEAEGYSDLVTLIKGLMKHSDIAV